MNAPRAVLYVRQSLDIQEGIDRQLSRTQELARLRGWSVVETYSDNDTSASKERGPKTAWSRMLQDAKRGDFDVVVSVDVDRLIRSTRDLLVLIDLGLKVVTVDGEIDLASADGEFRATMLAGIARFETRRKSERQVRANADRASKGRVNPGRRKFGYERGNRVPLESEAVWVRWLYDQAKAGASIRSMAQHLKREGVSVGGGTEWTTRRVRDTLLNPSYIGMTAHRGVWSHSDEVTPIIAPELAATVRALLSDPDRKKYVDNKVKHLMSGIARCGVCGSPMLHMRSYRCRADSSHPSILKSTLDDAVTKAVVKSVLFATKGPQGSHTPDDTALQLQAIRDSRAALLQLVADDAVSLTDVAPQLRDLKKREEALKSARDEHLRAASGADLRAEGARLLVPGLVTFKDATEATQRLTERFRDMPLDKQRELVRSHLVVVVNPGRKIERVAIEHLQAVTLN